MDKKILANRIEQIDIIKGVGILLMIMGHINFGEAFDIWIHAFHMPIFYVMSGYLFKSEVQTTEEFVVKKARQLLLPYFAFSALGFLMAYVLYGANAIDFWSKLNDVFFDPNIGGAPVVGAVWFFPVLFWINVIFHFLHKYFGHNDYVLFVITLIIGFMAMLAAKLYNIHLPMGLDAALVGVAFAGTGYFLKQMSQSKIVLSIFNMNAIIFIVFVVCHGCLIFLNGLVNFRAGIYQNVFLSWFNAVLGTILLWNLANCLSRIMNKWKKANIIREIAEIGEHSITFVSLNGLIISVVRQRLDNILILENLHIFRLKEIIILFVVCFVLKVIMEILENSKLKIMLGK